MVILITSHLLCVLLGYSIKIVPPSIVESKEISTEEISIDTTPETTQTPSEDTTATEEITEANEIYAEEIIEIKPDYNYSSSTQPSFAPTAPEYPSTDDGYRDEDEGAEEFF